MASKQSFNSRLQSSYTGVHAYIEKLRKNPNAVKILTLKFVVLSFLIAAATSITIISQRRLEQAEYKLFESRFNSVSENAIISVTNSFSRMNLNIREMSVTYGHVFPNVGRWPNVAWKGFQPTAALLSNISSVGGMGILPLVRSSQVASYQDFISGYYDTDPYCDRFTYMNPDYPYGEIWNVNGSSDFPFQLTARNASLDVVEEIFTPLSQYTFSSLISPHKVNYDLHGDKFYTRTIEMIINCTEKHEYDVASTSCGTLSPAFPVPFPTTQVPEPEVDDMVAVLLHPIFPADNKSSLVGFAAGTFSWKALLTNVIPADVSDIECVIEADGKVFTFCIENGVPKFMGAWLAQDDEYVHMRRSSAILGEQTAVAIGDPYVVSFYPTKVFQEQYQTERPKRGALVLFVSFLFCTLLFCSYDFLRQREFDRNQAVLDTKRRFVRFISHEIRTPLNTVRLGMKLLEVEMAKFARSIEGTTASDLALLITATLQSWKVLADEIVESSESAVEVLNDLLNYDKIEIGTLKLELAYCNIRGLVEKTVTAMKVQAQQKGVALELRRRCPQDGDGQPDLEEGECGMDDRIVVGDPARMGQVLRNLISNALKFTPTEGQVSVCVSVSSSAHGLPEKITGSSPLYQGVTHVGTLTIAVQDTGAGLSPQQLSEICAEGVQFNANELQAGQGSGLGLFISKGIIEQHGGKLVVASEGLGKGVTFTVELPLFRLKAVSDSMRSHASKHSHSESLNSDRTTAVPISSQSQDESPAAKPGRSLAIEVASVAAEAASKAAPSRLLVVDDSVFNRKMMARLLAAQDHVCEQAEDGEAAVRKYLEMVERGEPPDAILMDFEMPVMNGPTATARLRELGCACLIVGVTGNVLPQDVAFFLEHGANAVLPKPLVLEDFEQLLTGSLLRRIKTASGDDSDLAANPAESKKPQAKVAAVVPAAPGAKVLADQQMQES